jgi:hypothetical protein
MAKKIKSSQSAVSLPLKIVPSFFPVQLSENVSPLVKISDVLQNQGISKSHLCEAIAILIGLMSSKWGSLNKGKKTYGKTPTVQKHQ